MMLHNIILKVLPKVQKRRVSSLFQRGGGYFSSRQEVITAPWKILIFLEDPRVFEGRGKPRGLRRFRKTHLENILWRGS